MYKIKTIEEACEALGIDHATAFSAEVVKVLSKDELAYRMLKIIAQAINGKDYAPDWSNSDEWKYYPWFYMNEPKGPLGFGLSCNDYVYDFSYSFLGARLCYKSSEAAVYAGETFTGIYAAFMLRE